jgi:vancomycin permeability regulator SanA
VAPSAVALGAGSCAVLVAGYPTREDGSAHPLQRARVAAGVAALRAGGCTRLVLSGGAVHGRYVEAQTMAGLARERGVAAEQIVVEERARSTWQNVGCAAPLLAGFERVYLVSEGLHARRARRYLCRQQPGWCDRVVAVRSPWSTSCGRLRGTPFHGRSAPRTRRAARRAPGFDAAGALS